MKLTRSYESHAIAQSSCDFYCDPKAKKAGATKKIEDDSDDMSFLKGGSKDRNRFANKMNKPARRKKKK
jgi:hypothetical protein